MDNQKLSQLFIKANSLKLHKIVSQSQKKELENRTIQFITHQASQIALLTKQTSNLSTKLKQIESQSLNFNKNRFKLKNIENQQLIELSNTLTSIYQGIQAEQHQSIQQKLNKLNELHYKNLQQLDQTAKMIDQLTQSIDKQQKAIEIMDDAYQKQTHQFLDLILDKQKQEIKQIQAMEGRCQNILEGIQGEIVSKFHKWVQKSNKKRIKAKKGMGKFVEELQFKP